MIVECSKCETRFQLDESRVPLRGIRVRCSRCKEAFFLQHPSVGEAEASEAAVVPPAVSAAPEFAQDLAPESSLESEQEEDWQFNQEVPIEDPMGSIDTDLMEAGAEADELQPLEPLGIEEAAAADTHIDVGSGLDLAEDPPEAQGIDPLAGLGFDADEDTSEFGEASDFSALVSSVEEPQGPASEVSFAAGIAERGEPEEWDLFGDEPEPSASRETTGAVETLSETDGPEQSSDLGSLFATYRSSSEPRFGALRAGGRMLGWLVTVALCGLGVAQGVFHVASPASQRTASVDLGNFQVQEIRATWLETSRATRLYAVHGQLRNDSPQVVFAGGHVQVALLSRHGQRLEMPAAGVGLPLGEEPLRELPPERLAAAARGASAELAATRLEPGQGVEIQALFEEIPDAATSFRVEAVGSTREPRPGGVTRTLTSVAVPETSHPPNFR